ncbi:bifunctional hydroxymethylpyrimidine kinase/phosphomethylpyrimidine kinase [Sedimentibacter sp. zth1]|uniref:bifunctional hydroxymethylpyrimidine kinase/phosphomethylpyrimidine kinase n=1 Tax=Sedimentibacter sp. zth1 TaxID=2816908 RepID=UPI001A933806|nr:bifunctional hydroxymethylpyrimidine kinase/phosphomethylpyrimidine kinase [Sedimentibacter sp. zth1]QSX06314.1 bifunctional hydroxymethylpyrimidine kinase/phosphomethylpyrimidine kinase [Sedimentibacter sp. zth1]
MKKVLTIAGSDCSGGAGIQADIKTITVHRMYAMSAITALTAQNTTGVYGILEADKDFVANQMDCIFQDIYPDAVKIGMVSNAEIIKIIADKLKEYNAQNIVLDPVMVATSGSKLLNDDAIDTLVNNLIPLATVITPNTREAECLTDIQIETKEDMELAAKKISEKYKGYILIKGGHLKECSDDLLFVNGVSYWFEQENIQNDNTHGTGCTLSSAIACNLAKGLDIVESIKNAKEYITGALKANLNIGKGSGPLMHNFNI